MKIKILKYFLKICTFNLLITKKPEKNDMRQKQTLKKHQK